MPKERNSHNNSRQKIFLRTFGYQMNDAGSEVMERLLEWEGYRKIDSPEGRMS